MRGARVTGIQQVGPAVIVQLCWQISGTSQFIFFICHVTAPRFRELFLSVTRLWTITMNFPFTTHYFEKREGTSHRFSNCYSATRKQDFSASCPKPKQ